ncbi:hypothetical protein SAMN04487843_108194 [Methylobacterium sp. ap11]|uniref:hypothetical protein n=1 Tax=Methylobacterium sp. ap11 TaxID=1761799 RepID=UPI0008B5159D|nr:hypothetical protein [Methylobacterium sp. ap11]SEP21219.1 hypothetical protein SAMN04487843_108194 [Methylobacterium sp. ap11]
MHRIFLAALALACVCSPAMAGAGPIAEMLPTGGNPAHGLAFGLVLLGALALVDGVCLAARVRLPVLGILVAALIAGIAGPALAAEVATVCGTSIDLPWGAWLAAAMPSVASVAVTILGGVASAALAKLAPWATLFISQKRIEATIQTGLDYGINAVQGATKDARLTVPVGSQVLAVALQRIIDSTPAKIIDAVGGPAEIAKRLFRAMHLDENSSAALILEPILARMPATAR